MVSEMSKPIQENTSLNLNYKSIIYETESTPPQFETVIYRWNEDELDEDGRPLWERVAGPFIVDDFKSAEHFAQKHLSLMAGEVNDESVEEALHEEVREAVGHEDFSFLDIANYEVTQLAHPDKDEFAPIEVQKILASGDFYYTETTDGKWLSGFLFDEGQIRCWQEFSTLKEALIATQ